MQDDGGIDAVEEGLGRGRIGGDDGLGVVRAVTLDVRDGRIQPVHDLDREDRVQVLGVPVLGRGGNGARLEPAHGLVAADLAAGGDKVVQDRPELVLRDGPVDEQGLGRAADAGAPHLGVEHDPARHLGVGGGVDVGVAQTFQVRDHRDAAFVLDPLDQAAPAARHDDVDEVVHGQKDADRGPVAGRHALDRGLRQADLAQPRLQALQDRGRGVKALRAAAQDRRVARLQAQAAGVRGHVGAALVDDRDDPERHRDAGDLEAVGPLPLGQHAPHRVGEAGDGLEAIGHGLDARRVERQAVEHGAAQPLGPRRLHVLGVGGQEVGDAAAQGLGGGLQRPRLGPGVGVGELGGGGARRAAQALHLGAQVARVRLFVP